jgi:N6-adenosine-specific RNA methylase IME4
MSEEADGQWVSEGMELGERERSAHSLMWDIGDWWNRGEPYGDRARIVSADSWTGPRYGNCRKLGSVASRFPSAMRVAVLTFDHHALVAHLERDQSTELLRWCAETDPPRSTTDLKTRIKQLRRSSVEEELAESIASASTELGKELYGVIYADPPWHFAPYSVVTGMTVDDICALQVPASDDCVLFLWATAPMLPQALDVMKAWGFAYKSQCIWAKDRAGTGYWFRNAHELLLVGTRGNIPAPAPGDQFLSVIEAKAGAHSAKPHAFAEMIETMFPNLPAIELFARAPRLGWSVWGAEAGKVMAA